MLTLLFALCIACIIAWQVSIFFRSGLSAFPGPLGRKFTGKTDLTAKAKRGRNSFPDVFQFVDAFQGRTVESLQKCHQKYGKVVQIGPRTVSVSDPAMIPLIYGIRNPLPKVSGPSYRYTLGWDH
jgi:hypothetical protein